MRPHGGRTKKLIAAFHFHFSNRAGWGCGSCRKNGLEARRRCAWLPQMEGVAERVVWGRKHVTTTVCPISYITGESETWVEEFLMRRRLGQLDLRDLTARDAEAFLILEQEFSAESNDGR